MSSSGTDEIEVTPARAREMIEAGAQLVDVRETHEHEAGHVAGARLVPLGRLSELAATIDRDRPVVFLCRVGARSAMAAQAFRGAGYDAWSMAGGLKRWVDEGSPIEPADGRVADH